MLLSAASNPGYSHNIGTKINYQCIMLFSGLGWCSVVLCLIQNHYSTITLSYTLYYLGMSFTSQQLPWASCNNSWNTPACTLPGQFNVTSSTVILNMTSSAATVNMTSFDVTSRMTFNDMRASNETDILLYNTTGERLSAAEEFWLYEIILIIISSNSIVIVQTLNRDKKFLLINTGMNYSIICH